MKTIQCIFGAFLFVFSGCGKNENNSSHPPAPETNTQPPSPDTVGLFGESKRVTIPDVDREIISATPSMRSPGEASYKEWYEAWIKRIALEQIVAEKVSEENLDQDPELLQLVRNARRDLYVNALLSRVLQKKPPISEIQIREKYEALQEQVSIPESRKIYHIFLRFNETNREIVLEKLSKYRTRILEGENFGLLASQVSESESRNRQGLIGEIVRGQLPEKADKIIFALDEGKVSEPVSVADGAHIFFNENTTAGRTLSQKDLEPRIRKELEFERFRKTLEEEAAKVEISAPHYFPTEEEVKGIFTAKKKDSVILGLGTVELTLADFTQQLSREADQISPWVAPRELPLTFYKILKNREIVFHGILSNRPEFVSQLRGPEEKQKASILREAWMQQIMNSLAADQPSRVEEFHRSNQQRFQSPPRVLLSGIKIEIDSNAVQTMAKLESSVSALSNGETTWEALAPQVGGEVSEWGWFDPRSLSRSDPHAAKIAFGMSAGEVSAPYRVGNHIHQFSIDKAEPPKPLAFQQVKTAVVEHYIRANRQQLYKQITDTLFEESNLLLFPENYPEPAGIIAQ